jgi:hypothetical protein
MRQAALRGSGASFSILRVAREADRQEKKDRQERKRQPPVAERNWEQENEEPPCPVLAVEASVWVGFHFAWCGYT